MEYKEAQLLWKQFHSSSKMVNIVLPYDHAILLLYILKRNENLCPHKNDFKIAHKRITPHTPQRVAVTQKPTDGWVEIKMPCLRTAERNSAL